MRPLPPTSGHPSQDPAASAEMARLFPTELQVRLGESLVDVTYPKCLQLNSLQKAIVNEQWTGTQTYRMKITAAG